MKIFTLNRSSKGGSGSGPAWALLTILLGFLLLHLTSSPVWGTTLPPCGCPNVSCAEDEYCRIDDSCEPSGTGRCYSEDGNGNGGPICTCTTADGGCGIQTAIGCIPTDPGEFAGWILTRGIYLGVLVATLLIIISGFGIISSTGDPERLAEAKSQLTAAVAGLLFLLFSVIILRIIGCNIIGVKDASGACPFAF